ncbi:MAG: hypothetical protein LBQ37_04845 [Elusimicrobiota bacterium]|jgi:hypothetical protein|nr:hypothetical protein [Elusimicrobiota bacterium]
MKMKRKMKNSIRKIALAVAEVMVPGNVKSFFLYGKFALAVTVMAAALTACSGLSGLDVVGKDSVSSFEKVLNAIPDKVQADEMNVGWSLSAPDNTVRFIWSENYSKSPLYDVMLEFDAKPFVDAGLDTSKLPKNYTIYKGMLIVGTKLGGDDLKYSGKPTALAAYEQIVKKYRDSIGYHTALDHYNVNLGDGNLFEWAKDLSTNGTTKENQDKDIVFVLNPEPLIAAGVDPKKVKGWIYTTVNVDINGKPTDVYKFLKAFNLQ